VLLVFCASCQRPDSGKWTPSWIFSSGKWRSKADKRHQKLSFHPTFLPKQQLRSTNVGRTATMRETNANLVEAAKINIAGGAILEWIMQNMISCTGSCQLFMFFKRHQNYHFPSLVTRQLDDPYNK
jgi:hypothetical protein